MTSRELPGTQGKRLKHDTVTDEIQETAALRSLGALDSQEADAFDAHLREGCPVCEAELRRYEDVAREIGLSAPEVQPPLYLKDLLLARLEREGRPAAEAPPLAPVPPAEPSPAPGPSPAPEPSPARVISMPAGRGWRDYAGWAAAAAMALAAALSFYYYRQAEQTRLQQEQLVAAARNEAGELRTELETQSNKARELEQIHAALRSRGTRVFLLEGQEPAPSASIAVFWDTQQGRWIVSGYLPPPPQGKDYQLWLVTPNARTSAGLIKPDGSGHAFEIIDAPGPVVQPAAAAVTLEPSGGSPQPTLPLHLLGRIS
jgi:anti-sigma-K factor RskA